MLDEAAMAKLLGRSLTTNETTNFALYLNIATNRLEELLCVDLTPLADEDTSEERTFDTRYGYRTAYVDPFTSINSVSYNGETLDEDDYTIKQNDKYNGTWYNIIEFDSKRRGQKIVVDAAWGFDPVPDDLQLLLAKLFAQGSVEQSTDGNIKSKSIEDFSVTFKDSATYDNFVLTNSAVIDKYSQCNIRAIRNGSVRGYYDFRSIRQY